MGKIRIKTLGSAEAEEKEKQKAKARKEARLDSTRQTRLKSEEAKEAEKKTELPLQNPEKEEAGEQTAEAAQKESKKALKKTKSRPARVRGQKYQKALKLVDKTRLYPLPEAVSLVKKTSFSGFDGSVETHINVLEKGLSGNIQFPHDLGKKIEIAIASDKIIKDIEAGKINFDVLIASPEFMPKLAKFAKILGPRGLMPNPKAGTIGPDPEKLAEKFKKGGTRYKTETQAPIIHLVIGKVSFAEKDLEENLKAVISAIGPSKIKSLIVSSTMGPGIKVDVGPRI